MTERIARAQYGAGLVIEKDMVVAAGHIKNDLRCGTPFSLPIHLRVIRRLHEGPPRVEEIKGRAFTLATLDIFAERAHVERAALQQRRALVAVPQLKGVHRKGDHQAIDGAGLQRRGAQDARQRRSVFQRRQKRVPFPIGHGDPGFMKHVEFQSHRTLSVSAPSAPS